MFNEGHKKKVDGQMTYWEMIFAKNDSQYPEYNKETLINRRKKC